MDGMVGKQTLIITKYGEAGRERVWNLLVESEDEFFISGRDKFGKTVSIRRDTVLRVEIENGGGSRK